MTRDGVEEQRGRGGAPQSHGDLRMSGRGQVRIGAAPAAVYAAAADLRRMGEWSPVNRGGEWLDGDHLTVGARFRGWNRAPQAEWETIATIVEAVPGERFAFCVAPPGQVGTVWRYTFEPVDGGTLVTEAFEWQWTPVPAEGFRGRVGRMSLDEAAAAVARREQQLRQEIHETLAALKERLEADG